MTSTLNRIKKIELTPVPLDPGIDPDRFGLDIRITLFDNTKRPIIYQSREPELSFFQDLNKIFFKYEGKNIQDLLHKFPKKDVYNVFQYIFYTNFLYDTNNNITVEKIIFKNKKNKKVILPIQERYLRSLQKLLAGYIQFAPPPSQMKSQFDKIFDDHIQTYSKPNHI